MKISLLILLNTYHKSTYRNRVKGNESSLFMTLRSFFPPQLPVQGGEKMMQNSPNSDK
jgi:hypothetical protein